MKSIKKMNKQAYLHPILYFQQRRTGHSVQIQKILLKYLCGQNGNTRLLPVAFSAETIQKEMQMLGKAVDKDQLTPNYSLYKPLSRIHGHIPPHSKFYFIPF